MYRIHLVLLPYTTSTTLYIHHQYYCSTTPVYSTHPVYCTSTPVYTPYIAPVYRIYPLYMAPTGLGGGFRYRRGPWVVANHPGTAPVGWYHRDTGGTRDTGKPPRYRSGTVLVCVYYHCIWCIPLVLLCIYTVYTVYALPYTTSTTVYIHHQYYCSTTPVYSTHPVYCTSTPVYTRI